MKGKLKKFCCLSDEDILMIVLAFMSFSIGIWTNYRQLWLQDYGFNVSQISRILSVGLICSGVIAFIISMVSTKIKVKSVVMESIIFRSIALCILLINPGTYITKTCVLLCIMCEVIFSISYYPLLTYVNKSDSAFRKKGLIDYLARDAGVITCGLLIGVTLGNKVFDYNSCLFISLISCLLSGIFLILYNKENIYNKEKPRSLKRAFKSLFSSKTNRVFIIHQVVTNISFGMLYDLMMLILTGYIKFDVSFASVFIIVCNLVGSIACSIFNRYGKKLSVTMSAVIKYGTRGLSYIVAFFTNNVVFFVISIIIGYVTSRILDNKLSGTFLRRINSGNQFLFGNFRYLAISVGEGIGAFLAGILLNISLRTLFLVSGIITLLQVVQVWHMDYLRVHKK